MPYPWDSPYASLFRPTRNPGAYNIPSTGAMGRPARNNIITPTPGQVDFGPAYDNAPAEGAIVRSATPSTWNQDAYNASQNQGWASYDPKVYGQMPRGVTPGMIPAGQNWEQFYRANPNWAQDWNAVGPRDMQNLFPSSSPAGSQYQQPMDEVIGGGYIGPRYGRGDIGGFPDLTPPPSGSGVGQTAYDLGSFNVGGGGAGQGGGQFGGPGQPGDPLHTPYPYNEPYTLMGNAGFMPWATGSMLNNWITQYNSPNNQDPSAGIWGRNPLVDQLTGLYGGIVPSTENYNAFVNASAGGVGRSIADLYPQISNYEAFGNASGGNINQGVGQALGMFNRGVAPSQDWAQALFRNNLNVGDPGAGAGINIGQNYGLPGTNLSYEQMNRNFGWGGQQYGFGAGQQGRAGDLYNAIATGGVPLNRELFDLGQTAFRTLGQNRLPSERVAPGTAGMPAPAAALGQQANRLFGTQFAPQQVQAPNYPGPDLSRLASAANVTTPSVGQPDFFRDLLTRAMGAGTGITAPQIGALPGVTPPAGYRSGIGLQEQLSGQLSNQMRGAGLSPEYVAAARSRYLDPQMEALKGRLNVQGGGQAGLDSPLFQELARREERDFMDKLLMEGGDRLAAQQAQAQSLAAQQQAQDLALRGTDIAAQQFNAAQEAERQRANQAAMLTTQNLGVNAGLTGLGLGGQLSSQEIARQRANQGAGLQGQGMSIDALIALANAQQQGGQFGATQSLEAQRLNQLAGLQGFGNTLEANRIGAGMLGQQADIEARLAQFNPELALRAALANQENVYRTGMGDAGNAFRQADLARAIAGDYSGLAERVAAGQGTLGQMGFENALRYGGANTDLFNALSGQNMAALNLANQFGRQPAEFQIQGLDRLLGNQGQLFNFADQLMGRQRGAVDPQLQLQQQLFGMLQGNQAMGNQFLQGQQAYQAGQQGIGADILRTSLGGDYDIARQFIAAMTNRDIQGAANTGAAIQAAIQASPGLISMLLGLFRG